MCASLNLGYRDIIHTRIITTIGCSCAFMHYMNVPAENYYNNVPELIA